MTTTNPALQAGEECRQAAHAYLQRGWSPLALCPPDHIGTGKEHCKACQSPGKRPWYSWKEYQTARMTADQIDQLWKTNPAANVGIALGPVSGLVRIDSDGPGARRKAGSPQQCRTRSVKMRMGSRTEWI